MTKPKSPVYSVGTRIRDRRTQIMGIVVEPYKFVGDICVLWDDGQESSYDEWFLDDTVDVVDVVTE